MTTNLAYDYIDNIPWEENPAFSFQGSVEDYMKSFRNVIKELPVKNCKINFDDEVWDFNPYCQTTGKANKIRFSDVPETERNYLKFFVLHGIMSAKKISSLQVRVQSFRTVYMDVTAKHPLKNFATMTTNDIIESINNGNRSPSTAHNLFLAIYQIGDFVTKNYKIELAMDLDDIYQHGLKYKIKEKKNRDKNKIPSIPQKYFDLILNKAVEKMRDDNTKYNDRMIAAIIVLVSQVGLRLNDLLELKTNCLHKTELKKSGNVAYYITYTARKPSKPSAPLLEFNIFSNKLSTEAIQTICKIREQCELSKGTDYLIVFECKRGNDLLPVLPSTFRDYYNGFMYNYLAPYCFQEWEGISPVKYFRYRGGKKSQLIYIPSMMQYRVHMATSLYEQGVPLAYIQKFMSHLSEYMMGYYVRPKDTYQENIQYSEKVIREIVEDDVTPLGGSMLGEDIKANIQKFVADNKLNVHDDIESVVKALGDRVIIRGKSGGVCIKTSLMPCSQDARTNEMMCAYNLCPNLFHFYYMVDVSLIDYETLKQTYQTMKKNGNTRAAQKELSKVKALIRKKLIPELDELQAELAKKGFDEITSRYPSLMPIIENYDDIRKDIELWTTKD